MSILSIPPAVHLPACVWVQHASCGCITAVVPAAPADVPPRVRAEDAAVVAQPDPVRRAQDVADGLRWRLVPIADYMAVRSWDCAGHALALTRPDVSVLPLRSLPDIEAEAA
ncbi:hypothetical protein ACGFX7_06445 [Streptomyces harbinensis]|uniref:hypothetical protein n=1 Tax=Streptomyces harbinensis TaxID=1176198 RepID=UPI003710F7DD